MLHARGISIDIGDARIVSDISVEIAEGEFVGLIGPNGSGKTTMPRGLHRSLKPAIGNILIQSDDLWHLSAVEAARRIVAPDAFCCDQHLSRY